MQKSCAVWRDALYSVAVLISIFGITLVLRGITMEQKRFLTLCFLDGTDMSITFPQQAGNPLLPARQVQAALYADKGMLETDGELMLIPKSSIKYMTVSPLAVELPETVIRGGSVVTAWSVFGG